MALALGVAGLVGAGLIAGFHPQIGAVAQQALNVIDLTAAEPEQVTPDTESVTLEKPKAKEDEGKAAPPNKKSEAAQVTAPKPKVQPVIKSQTSVAEKMGQGNDSTQGAAEQPGPGTGAGGQGTGTGSGAFGSGRGGGGGGGVASRARKISGEIVKKDYPKVLQEKGQRVVVQVRFTVGADGRPKNCRTYKSSGYAVLDEVTCNVVVKRFRYEPARTITGQPVEDVTGWSQTIYI